MKARDVLFAWFVWTVVSTSASAQDKGSSKPARIKQLLTEHCHRCHGADGANEGGLNFLLDRRRLVASGLVVPGEPKKSKLYQRIEAGEMPADGESLPAKEQDLVRTWIAEGAAELNPTRSRPTFISTDEVIATMRVDLDKITPRHRRFYRYFTLTHLHNAGLSSDELQSYRHAISKLVNSLSWGREIVVPEPIDPDRTVLRIDLRSYKWTDNGAWDLIIAADPYAVRYRGKDADYCYEATGTKVPHVRGDWFVAAAARPPLYHETLGIPATALELDLTQAMLKGLGRQEI